MIQISQQTSGTSSSPLSPSSSPMHPRAPPATAACGMATDGDGCGGGGGGGDPVAPGGGNLYAVLGLSKVCSDADLKVAHRKLAMMASGQMLILKWHQAHGGGLGEVLGDPGCLFGSQSPFSQGPYSVSVTAMYSISCMARIPSMSSSAASRTSSGTRSTSSGRCTQRYARCGCPRGCARRPWRSLHMSWRGWTRSSS